MWKAQPLKAGRLCLTLPRRAGASWTFQFPSSPTTPLSPSSGCRRPSSTYLSLPPTRCPEASGDGLNRPGGAWEACGRAGARARARAGTGAAVGTEGSILRGLKPRRLWGSYFSEPPAFFWPFLGDPFIRPAWTHKLFRTVQGWGTWEEG